jgi:hypothetical protein
MVKVENDMKINKKSLCATCMNMSERVVETSDDLHDYARNGQGYNYEYACSAGHKLFAHQVVVKCINYCIEGVASKR